MILCIKQDRPADQKHNTFYFILGEQWSNLTVHDMRTALVNAGLENHRSQTTAVQFHIPFIFYIYEVPHQWETCLIQETYKNGASAFNPER